MRALLDSNVWLAILTTDGFCRQVWRKARQTWHFTGSREVLDEIEEKLRIKFGFSCHHAALMTFFVRRQIELSVVVSAVNLCRDRDDNCILAASLDSKSSHLVTGDQDLLVLKEFEGIRIVTPREFWEPLPTE